MRRPIGLGLGLMVFGWVFGWVAPAWAGSLSDAVAKATPETVQAYEWFHAHPELSGEEEQTAARMAKELRALGLEVQEGIGGHGLVGVLRNGEGPVVLYRADMDGLPVSEKTGLPYASENDGVMHACGHDVHMATALGALRTLIAIEDQWKGTVLFVGQPAEEIGRGAKDMLADPAFEKILKQVGKPRLAVALHDSADLPAGQVSVIDGFHYANVDSVDIVVHGKGGHGARPHETIDPVVIGSEIVLALQTIVSRRLPPGEMAVVTVGKFAAGTKHNIVPPTATLLLTVRSYSAKTRKTLLDEIGRIARQVSKAHRAPRAPDVRVSEGIPAAFNDVAWTGKLRQRFSAAIGKDNVLTHEPSAGGEDFGLFSRKLGIPGVMWKLGAVDPKRWKEAQKSRDGAGLPGLHSDRWAPAPVPTLRTGIVTAVEAVLAGLSSSTVSPSTATTP